MKSAFTNSRAVRSVLGVVAAVSASSAFALTLPGVTSCGYAPPFENLMCYTSPETGGRLYVGSVHDDFISYSANNLAMYAGIKDANNNPVYTSLSEWGSLPSFGSGQIVKIFSFNNSNNGTFPDPTIGTNDNKSAPDADLTPKNDGQYAGQWPVGASVTIAQLKAFLGAGVTSPVFTFDLNELAPGLDLNGFMQVRRNGVALNGATFAFDNIANHSYDPNSLVHALRTQPVSWFDPVVCAAFPGNICTVDVDNDVGSGKPDFFTYAMNFNLYDYQDTDTLYFYMAMADIDSGGEELALTNAVTPTNQVPEPASLVLLGAAILGLGIASRGKNKA
ncbi:PEP-CTERM sorting domain-containing protein [Dechloromonas sp. XY25]|uniref:PEP-CTERM sorting domain-containing protein n=1 Tax=Dechloromonas hankyongensis TaxID=2908002 RepID=A0ABS9K4C5_9RHOO|nr:PEP-CTERM sorting domain-containing protein [Dechloromonas hankyongensis]MCG2578029.1 PEP-CTERM sorting domain-containing protein [Dechloromonas hankyongensis]